MQLPTQRPALRRDRRLHPALGRHPGQGGIAPSEALDLEDMDDSDNGDDADDGDGE